MAESSAEARVFVLAGPDLARSFVLGERTTLGRSDECEVVLHDRSISRKHAVIVRQGERWFVQDLGSTNGVSKDGERAERLELADGDEFKLGDLPLRFKLTPTAEADDIEFDLGPPAAPALAAPAPAAAAPAPRAPAASARGPSRSPAKAEDDEIEIEEAVSEEELEIELEGGSGARASSASVPAPTVFRPARAERRTGFFAGDLEQRPFWVRVVLFLALLAIAGGLAYGTFHAVQMLRSGL
jgi:predicted component of type VI protein secretion system